MRCRRQRCCRLVIAGLVFGIRSNQRDSLEAEAVKLEAEISTTEAALANFVNAEEPQRQSKRLDALRERLDAAMLEWATLAETIEEEEEG